MIYIQSIIVMYHVTTLNTCVLYFITSKGRGIVYISGILQFQVPICSKVQLFSIFVNKALSLKTNYPLHIFYKNLLLFCFIITNRDLDLFPSQKLKLKGTSIYFRQILVFLKGKHDV
jgi:hypothetical protein